MASDLLTPHEIAARLGVSPDDLPRVAGLLAICLDLSTGLPARRLHLKFTRCRPQDLQALIDSMGSPQAAARS